jgi:predicted regulator of Ras-like GTPase activity (Roadblock/LC7/MglB family)
MPGIPPLISEDVELLDGALDDFLRKSEALTALIIDKGGPVLSQRGAVKEFDTTTISALAAGAFSATEAIAGIISENGFSNIYQQGVNHSLLFCNIDADLLLIIIFKAEISVGAIKYFAATTVGQVSAQMQKARARAPEEMVDLVSMNVLDAGSIFRKSE